VPSTLKETPSINYSYDNYIMELKGRLQTAHEIVRQKLISHKVKSKGHSVKSTQPLISEAGQKVLLYDETVCRGRSKMVSLQYIRLYDITVVKRINATIRRGRNAQQVHVNQLKSSY
jgi:hypothetical protein